MRRTVSARVCLRLGVVLIAAGCQTYDPLYCDSDDRCMDPERPFCDVDGEYPASEGVARTCIPDPTGGNDAGDGAGEPDAEDEPDPRMCAVGDAVPSCEEGVYKESCDDGTVLAQEECPLGCHADEPRCNDLEPSNGLAALLDMADAAQDIELPDDTVIDTVSGEITLPRGKAAIQNVLVGQAGAPSIRVYIVKSVILNDVIVTGENALAFIADGAITVQGRVQAGGQGRTNGAGARVCISILDGLGGDGVRNGLEDPYNFAGGGGAGHGAEGASGGDSDAVTTPGGGGFGSGTEPGALALTPLRGGCEGGRSGQGGGSGFTTVGGGGGGAVQLSSRTSIALVTNTNGTAIIDVGGGGGPEGNDGNGSGGGGGGGSGGGVLLEAPSVAIEGMNVVIAAGGGGGGGGCESPGQDGRTSSLTASGGSCKGSLLMSGGRGGAIELGGDAVAPIVGANVTATSGDRAAGGGGGAYGRVRINTASGEFALGTGGAIYAATSFGAAAVR